MVVIGSVLLPLGIGLATGRWWSAARRWIPAIQKGSSFVLALCFDAISPEALTTGSQNAENRLRTRKGAPVPSSCAEILARTGYLRGVPAARQAGANAVFPGEGGVALALVSAILQNLGATPEQIERERDRIHMETT